MLATRTTMSLGAARRIRALAVLVAAAGISPGCSTYRPALGEPSPDAQVSVDFRRPTTISVLTSGGDTIRLDDVTGLRGRVDSVTPDTVYLRLSAVSGSSRSSGRIRVNAMVAVARQPDVLIQQRELAPGRTSVLVLASVMAIAALGVAVFLLTFNPA